MTTVQAPEGAALHQTWQNVPTQTLNAGSVEFAYRQLGPSEGVPVVFLTHLAAVLDNWDPRVVDGIAARHRVIASTTEVSAPPAAPRRRRSRRWQETPSPSSAPSASIRPTCSGSRRAA